MREENEGKEEEITLREALLEMADKLRMYCLRKGIPDVHSQISEIADQMMNFTTKNLKQSPIVSCFSKPVSPSL